MSGSVSGRKVAATSFFALAVLSPAFAADPDLVITPNRTETPISRAGSAVTIITGEEIERMRGQSFVDVLRNVPGLDIYQNGGFGSQATVSLRGARDGQTLVMIDGIRAGDPSSTAGAVDSPFTISTASKFCVARNQHFTVLTLWVASSISSPKKDKASPRRL